MFGKAYKLKSNNTLKNSEKKNLAQRILNEFPAATDEKVKEVVPVKSNTSCMKLMLHSGESVGVYVVDNVPMMIETGDLLVPTVCALWKVPDLLPTLIIHSPVLPKLAGGAPLYAPGVTLSDAASFPRFPRGALVAAATADNSAAGAIGRAAISSTDLLRTTMGVCMETLHVFGDLLCKEPKFAKLERPKLQPPAYCPTADNITADIAQLNIQQPIREEWPSLVRESKDTPPTVKLSHSPVLNEPKTIPEEETQVDNNEVSEFDETVMTDSSQIEEDPIPTDMDELLQWCLLSFIKLEGKNLQLPLKTNLLYKNHLMPLCPSDRSLDVKKSSYKKMSKFLEAMQQEGLLEVREVEKGVSAVVGVATSHPRVRAHRPAPCPAPAPGHAPRRAAPRPPAVRDLYCVTAAVAQLLAPHKKGTALSAAQVRAALAEHVRAHHLAAQHGKLRTDPLLAALVGPQVSESISWESAMSAVLGKMTPSTELHFPDGSVKLIKSRLEPIKMHVVTRSGNKKVTLVSNLESYGFRPGELAREVQLGAAASSGVTRSPGAKADQLMVQGDQTHFIAKLLIEKYNLPKKYLEGADKALNKKK
ncbi:eukaryotic translation initiation factor 2D [Papilio machaon]|uniref:eukaryotic translation initiation factor 2D n=1 Tax=Papilio machaon TaxID=76193 RepID=UPI001E663A5D|nr:eukaryotic translation initiation factor 2D [Papilio machaon]